MPLRKRGERPGNEISSEKQEGEKEGRDVQDLRVTEYFHYSTSLESHLVLLLPFLYI